MQIVISKKRYNASQELQEVIEEMIEEKLDRLTKYLNEDKLSKLSRYFSPETVAKVVLSTQRGRSKVEVTINANGIIFRGEEIDHDIYDAVDRLVSKLSKQMSKYKSKLEQRHTCHKDIVFKEWPDTADEEAVLKVAKIKRFDVAMMKVEEALLQMEMLGHAFFAFINSDTEEVNVAYQRKDGTYGLLELTA